MATGSSVGSPRALGLSSLAEATVEKRDPDCCCRKVIKRRWNLKLTDLWFCYLLQAFYFVSVVVMSYASAFVLAVCVEFPTMQLENVLFFRNKKARGM